MKPAGVSAGTAITHHGTHDERTLRRPPAAERRRRRFAEAATTTPPLKRRPAPRSIPARASRSCGR